MATETTSILLLLSFLVTMGCISNGSTPNTLEYHILSHTPKDISLALMYKSEFFERYLPDEKNISKNDYLVHLIFLNSHSNQRYSSCIMAPSTLNPLTLSGLAHRYMLYDMVSEEIQNSLENNSSLDWLELGVNKSMILAKKDGMWIFGDNSCVLKISSLDANTEGSFAQSYPRLFDTLNWKQLSIVSSNGHWMDAFYRSIDRSGRQIGSIQAGISSFDSDSTELSLAFLFDQESGSQQLADVLKGSPDSSLGDFKATSYKSQDRLFTAKGVSGEGHFIYSTLVFIPSLLHYMST